ncbi:MAG: hypothetical protein H6Q68_3849 [Firmicutes bacterium]|nr:hypothetical protein [Bacillota bacterium]
MVLSCKNKISNAPKSANTSLSFQPSPGTFIYCNNPEQLFTTDLGDNSSEFGNHYLLWSLVSGTCYAYYEHENMTGLTIGYGLQIYNPNEHPVTVEVTNVGFSNNAFDCWTQFYSNKSGESGSIGFFTIQPGEVLWIQRNDNKISPGAIFNGAAAFNVSGDKVYVFHYAYHNFNNIDGTASYLGYITRTDPNGQTEAMVYKGTAEGFVQASLFNINISSIISQTITWQTHACPGNDMVTITCPLTDTSNPTYTTFTCSNEDNLGNWGIRYHYTLTINNDTSRKKTISFVIAQPYFISNVYVWVTNSGKGCTINKTNWKFCEFTLLPKAKMTVSYEVVLSGSSYGGLINSIIATLS